MTIPNVDNTTLNDLVPNLDVGDVADPVLRLNAFQYIYQELQVIINEINNLPAGNIQDSSITAVKLANLAVVTGKIADLAITTNKINDLAVTLAKMANNSVGTSQIIDLSISANKIMDGVLTAAKFVPGALTNDTQNGLRITALQAETEQQFENVDQEFTDVNKRLDLSSFARYGYFDQSIFPFDLGFDLYRDMQGLIQHDFNFNELSSGFTNVYLDNKDGSDANNGLTTGTPVQTIGQALTVAHAQPGATVNIVFLQKLVGLQGSEVHTISKNINFLSNHENGSFIFTGYYPQTYTWTLASGVYRTSRTNTYKVFDTAQLDFRRNPREITKVNSLADCQAKRGTWYTDGTLVYVNRLDGSSPASDYGIALMLPINVGFVINAAGYRFYIDNVHFNTRANTTSPNNLTLNGDASTDFVIRRSSFKFARNNGLAVTNFNRCFVFDSVAEYCIADGFNYHGNADCKVFEYYCYSHSHGLGGSAQNINATTAHDGMSIIRVGTVGHDTSGPVLADVNGCDSFNIDCVMYNSLRSAAATKAAFYVDELSASKAGTAYFINCSGGGTDTFAINSDGLVDIYLQNFKGAIPTGFVFTQYE